MNEYDVKIERPNDETQVISIRVNGEWVEISYTHHDAEGWAGMDAAEKACRAFANALGFEVIES